MVLQFPLRPIRYCCHPHLEYGTASTHFILWNYFHPYFMVDSTNIYFVVNKMLVLCSSYSLGGILLELKDQSVGIDQSRRQ